MLMQKTKPKPKKKKSKFSLLSKASKNPNFSSKISKISKFPFLELTQIKMKITFVSKVMKMQTTLRQEHEQIVKLKGMTPDNKIPMSLLLDRKKFLSGNKSNPNFKISKKSQKNITHNIFHTYIAKDKFISAYHADKTNE